MKVKRQDLEARAYMAGTTYCGNRDCWCCSHPQRRPQSWREFGAHYDMLWGQHGADIVDDTGAIIYRAHRLKNGG